MAAMLPVMTMVSCSDDLPDLPGNPSRHDFTGVTLEIPVSAITRSAGATAPSFLPSNPFQTRAEAAAADIAENECNITSLHFFAYKSGDTKPIHKNIPDEINTLSFDEYAIIKQQIELPVGVYKFYVVANHDFGSKDLDKLTVEELLDETETYGMYVSTVPANGLPMACRHEDIKIDNVNGSLIPAGGLEIKGGESPTLYCDLKFTVAKVSVEWTGPKSYSGNSVLTIQDLSEKVPLFEQNYSGYGSLADASSADVKEIDDNGNVSTLKWEFYVPERILSTSTTDMTKMVFKLEDYAGKEWKLGTEGSVEAGAGASVADLTAMEIPENPTHLERSHWYTYKLNSNGGELDIKFSLSEWTPQIIKADLMGPAVLTVSETRIGFGRNYTYGDDYNQVPDYATDEDRIEDMGPVTGNTPRNLYYVADREISLESQTDGSRPYLILEPKTDETGHTYIKVSINPQANYDVNTLNKVYFNIKSGDLTKKIEVLVDPKLYLEVSPYIETINIVNYRELEDHIVEYQYATNYDNLSCTVSYTEDDDYLSSSAKYNDGFPTTSNLGEYLIASSTGSQADLGMAGIQNVTMQNTYDGYKYTKEHTIKFHYIATKGSEKAERDVYLHIIPQASTKYIVHFKCEDAVWDTPHIYVYQPLEMVSSSSGIMKEVKFDVQNNPMENALQYSITGCATFKGWGEAEKHNISLTEYADYFKDNNKSLNMGNEDQNGTYYMYDIDYIAEHRQKIRELGKCTGRGCAKGGTDFIHKWPGVMMYPEGDGWYRIELPEVCRPGKTLIMFTKFHRDNLTSTTERWPNNLEPGIPLFNYDDREGWFLYNTSNPTKCKFTDDKPEKSSSQTGNEGGDENTKTYNFRLYWDKSQHDLYQIEIKTTTGKEIVAKQNYSGILDNSWWMKDFQIEAKNDSEFDTMYIVPKFYNNNDCYMKNYTPSGGEYGSIPMKISSGSWWKLEDGRYVYGKGDNELTIGQLKKQ